MHTHQIVNDDLSPLIDQAFSDISDIRALTSNTQNAEKISKLNLLVKLAIPIAAKAKDQNLDPGKEVFFRSQIDILKSVEKEIVRNTNPGFMESKISHATRILTNLEKYLNKLTTILTEIQYHDRYFIQSLIVNTNFNLISMRSLKLKHKPTDPNALRPYINSERFFNSLNTLIDAVRVAHPDETKLMAEISNLSAQAARCISDQISRTYLLNEQIVSQFKDILKRLNDLHQRLVTNALMTFTSPIDDLPALRSLVSASDERRPKSPNRLARTVSFDVTEDLSQLLQDDEDSARNSATVPHSLTSTSRPRDDLGSLARPGSPNSMNTTFSFNDLTALLVETDEADDSTTIAPPSISLGAANPGRSQSSLLHHPSPSRPGDRTQSYLLTLLAVDTANQERRAEAVHETEIPKSLSKGFN